MRAAVPGPRLLPGCGCPGLSERVRLGGSDGVGHWPFGSEASRSREKASFGGGGLSPSPIPSEGQQDKVEVSGPGRCLGGPCIWATLTQCHWDLAFLTGSQVTLLLQVWGPHLRIRGSKERGQVPAVPMAGLTVQAVTRDSAGDASAVPLSQALVRRPLCPPCAVTPRARATATEWALAWVSPALQSPQLVVLGAATRTS